MIRPQYQYSVRAISYDLSMNATVETESLAIRVEEVPLLAHQFSNAVLEYPFPE